jgi:uncharacterized protein (TIGR02172 family)
MTQTPGELIARGRTADIHAWGEGQVLKLFQPWADRGMVEYEQRLAQTVIAAGVKAPAVGEIVSQGERLGLVYERVNAESLLKRLMAHPWQARQYARQMAELHAAMHAARAPDLPPMHERLAWKIRRAKPLSEALRQAALTALEKLPQDDAVCHGDFHPDNILVTARGLMVIDWIDATAGHPLGDFARSELLILHGTLPDNPLVSGFLDLFRRTFYTAYKQRYFSLSQHTPEQVRPWLPVVAAARLDEGIAEEEQNLLRMARAGLGVV